MLIIHDFSHRGPNMAKDNNVDPLVTMHTPFNKGEVAQICGVVQCNAFNLATWTSRRRMKRRWCEVGVVGMWMILSFMTIRAPQTGPPWSSGRPCLWLRVVASKWGTSSRLHTLTSFGRWKSGGLVCAIAGTLCAHVPSAFLRAHARIVAPCGRSLWVTQNPGCHQYAIIWWATSLALVIITIRVQPW